MMIRDMFLRSYIETALWSSSDDGTPLDRNYSVDDLAPETLARMTADCAAFEEQAGEMINGNWRGAGHDFWLTRNGHGAGFWDGDWSEHGDKLTEISKTFGTCDLYVGDDGRLYVDQEWNNGPRS